MARRVFAADHDDGGLSIIPETVSISQRGCMDRFSRIVAPYSYLEFDGAPLVGMVKLALSLEDVDAKDLIFNPVCADHHSDYGFDTPGHNVPLHAKCVVCNKPATAIGTLGPDGQRNYNCLECNWSGPAWPHVQGNQCPVCGTKAIAMESKYHVS